MSLLALLANQIVCPTEFISGIPLWLKGEIEDHSERERAQMMKFFNIYSELHAYVFGRNLNGLNLKPCSAGMRHHMNNQFSAHYMTKVCGHLHITPVCDVERLIAKQWAFLCCYNSLHNFPLDCVPWLKGLPLIQTQVRSDTDVGQ